MEVEDYRELLKKRRKRLKGRPDVVPLPKPPGPPKPKPVMIGSRPVKKKAKKGGPGLLH